MITFFIRRPNASVNSGSAHPSGNIAAFSNVFSPGATLGHFIRGFESLKMMETFIGQDVDFVADKLAHQGLEKLVDVMFLKVYFLHFRYFFIAQKQQLVLYFYMTYREIENNQRGEFDCLRI